jgi:alcohol dehydrogenase, propanol-preferring
MTRAWAVTGLQQADKRLTPVDRPSPALAHDEVRLQVLVCGVCRTDLHLAAGDLGRDGRWWSRVTRWWDA